MVVCSNFRSMLGWKAICHAFLWPDTPKLGHTVRIFALSHSNCPLKFNQDVFKTSFPKYLILALNS